MALDFPSTPTDGQIYGKYYWNNTAGVWQLLSDTTTFGLASNTPTGSYTDGADYEYVSFTASGTLTVTRGGFFDILLVGGGGGGGDALGGGGGAGGHIYAENLYLPAGSLDVVVGAGAPPMPNGTVVPQSMGGSSRLGSIFAVGGGTGGTGDSISGSAGASGGGHNTTAFFSLNIVGQGNHGGKGRGAAAPYGGGGGGGASAVGGNASGTISGSGGSGTASSITGASITRAGGGGGGTRGGTPGTGGVGGGGAGAGSGATATSGTANTGGGGGGSDGTGGSGGSGIVIVRWRA